MHNIILEIGVRDIIAKAFSELCNNGYIRIKSVDNLLLSELRLAEPAFKEPENGVLIANDIYPDTMVNSTGTAYKYEIYMADGETKILTGTVGLSGEGYDLELPFLELTAGSQLQIESYTHIVSE